MTVLEAYTRTSAADLTFAWDWLGKGGGQMRRTETDRQRDRQTDGQTDRHRDRQIDRLQ